LVTEHDRFGRATAEPLADLPLERAARVQHLLAGREMRHAHRLAARLDGHLVEPVLRMEQEPRDGVTGLVHGDARPLALGGAGSRSSVRLVAPMTRTCSRTEKPSISTRSWLSERSSSLWERFRPRRPPSASISSMKMTPPCFRALAKRCLSRAAPRPTRNPV